MLLHSDARNDCPGLEATVTLCHRHTPREQLKYFTKNADIIVSATGKTFVNFMFAFFPKSYYFIINLVLYIGVVNLITSDIVKPGACVIDVGITRIQTEEGKTKLVGDVDFESKYRLLNFVGIA